MSRRFCEREQSLPSDNPLSFVQHSGIVWDWWLRTLLVSAESKEERLALDWFGHLSKAAHSGSGKPARLGHFVGNINNFTLLPWQ